METQAKKPRVPIKLWALLAMNGGIPLVCFCAWKYQQGVSAKMALEAGAISFVFLNPFFLLMWRKQKKAAQGVETQPRKNPDTIRMILLIVLTIAAFWTIAEPMVQHPRLGYASGSGTVALSIVLIVGCVILLRDHRKKSTKNSK